MKADGLNDSAGAEGEEEGREVSQTKGEVVREKRMMDELLTQEIAELRRQLAEARIALSEAANEINCAGPVAHRIRILKKEHAEALAEAQQELKDHEASFNLRWESDMRAIRRWQEAHPGNDNVWPDHTDLSVWLMGERDTYARLLRDVIAAFEHVKKSECTCYFSAELCSEIEAALKPGVSEPASEPKEERR